MGCSHKATVEDKVREPAAHGSRQNMRKKISRIVTHCSSQSTCQGQTQCFVSRLNDLIGREDTGFPDLPCTGMNSSGKWADGGGCNSSGCWYPGGGCNSSGCWYPGGGCNSSGCWYSGGGCNSSGCWMAGGGCNSSGCWLPGGGCNSSGCWAQGGHCNSSGCINGTSGESYGSPRDGYQCVDGSED